MQNNIVNIVYLDIYDRCVNAMYYITYMMIERVHNKKKICYIINIIDSIELL